MLAPSDAVARRGYDSDLFLEAVTEELKCRLCWKVCRNAVEATCEEHRDSEQVFLFCEACLAGHLETHGGQCPITPHGSHSQPSEYIRKVIGRQKVRCPCGEPIAHSGEKEPRPMVEKEGHVTVEEGVCDLKEPLAESGELALCPWEGPLRSFDAHMASCSFMAHCELKEFGCPFRGSQRALAAHMIAARARHLKELVVRHRKSLKERNRMREALAVMRGHVLEMRDLQESYETEIVRQRKEKPKGTDTVAALRKQLADLTTKHDQLMIIAHRTTTLENELKAFFRSPQGAKLTREEAMRFLSSPEAAEQLIYGAKSLVMEKEMLESQLGAAVDACQSMKAEISALKEQSAPGNARKVVSRLTAEKEQLKKLFASASAETKKMHKEHNQELLRCNEEKKRALERVKRLTAEKDQLQKQLASVAQENGQLRNEQKEMEEAITTLTDTHKEQNRSSSFAWGQEADTTAGDAQPDLAKDPAVVAAVPRNGPVVKSARRFVVPGKGSFLSREDESALVTMLPKRWSVPRWRLLYQASTVSKKKVQTLQDRLKSAKGPTLTIVRSATGAVFGGFASKKWSFPGKAKMVADSDAFVFRAGKVGFWRVSNGRAALCHWNGFGPAWGIRGDALNVQWYRNSFVGASIGCSAYALKKKELTGQDEFDVQDFQVWVFR